MFKAGDVLINIVTKEIVTFKRYNSITRGLFAKMHGNDTAHLSVHEYRLFQPLTKYEQELEDINTMGYRND